MTSSVVYFVLSNELIKIGFGRRSRVRAGLTYGARLLGCLPAGRLEETRIHERFRHLRVRVDGADELFRPDPDLTDWIEHLASAGYSAEDYDSALQLPELPFSVWEPGSEKKFSSRHNGQTYLFDHLPLADRIALKHKDATLSSAGDDWYTPSQWAELADAVMGSIDLDPASCSEANKHYIKARKWYNKEINGLDMRNPWGGNVWLNPPYGRGEGSAQDFIRRLHHEVRSGAVRQVITCLNLNSMSSLWFEPLYELGSAHSIPRGRIAFLAPRESGKTGSSPSKGTVFTYIGQNVDRFIEHFGPHGQILKSA